ncbi:MAG: class I SAM-dependent methyltransferase [Patescibacteria group bacterium]
MDSFLDKFIRLLRTNQVKKHIAKGSVVCDIGCGKDFYFLKKISNKILRGIGFDEEVSDWRDEKYELIRQKISDRIPLEKESCDAVTMTAVLEHLVSPQEILDESFRVLKNGGKLILTTPTPAARPFLNFLAHHLRLIDKHEIENHKNYFDANTVRRMLKKSGFAEENIKNYFFELFLNNLIVAKK